MQNSNPEVLLWTLKPPEDGARAGLIVRVWNVGASAQNYRLTLTGGISRATRATHIETDMASANHDRASVSASAAATQIQTLRIVPQP